MKLLRACYDWRVLTGLGALGIGIYVVAPGLIVGALPLLVLAACPLSMLLMMKAMSGHAPASDEPAKPIGMDRVNELRQELSEMARRQEQLAAELDAIEGARAGTPGGSEPAAGGLPPMPSTGL